MNADNRRKKEYLMQYRGALQHEADLNRQLEEVQQQYLLRSQKLDGMPRSGAVGDLSDYAARYDELLTELHKAAAKTLALRTDITRRIESMQDETEITLMYLRYIQGYPFEEVAERMHISLRGIYYLHGTALHNFSIF